MENTDTRFPEPPAWLEPALEKSDEDTSTPLPPSVWDDPDLLGFI